MKKDEAIAIAAELEKDVAPSLEARVRHRNEKGQFTSAPGDEAAAAERKKKQRRRDWRAPDGRTAAVTRKDHEAVLRALRNEAARCRSWGAAVAAEVARGRVAGFNLPPIEGLDGAERPETREESQARVVEWLRMLDREGLFPRVFVERLFEKELGRLGFGRADLDRLRETESGTL